MKILPLNSIEDKVTYLTEDSNGREINIYSLKNVVPIGTSLFYPNVLFYSPKEKKLIKPINERTMSLKDIEEDDEFTINKITVEKVEHRRMFFFVYNTDNYFHFLYDSLPYLMVYRFMRYLDPNIKLLMNYPNENKKEFYKFVLEFLKLLGITENDIQIIDGKTRYRQIYLSNSFTHDFDSNLPPRKEIYSFYRNIARKVDIDENTPIYDKIYISRRTWMHNDLSNIGTNYTTRRKMVNEDELVAELTKKGYKEVFTETMTTEEKITMFANAKKVIGAIGGGIANVLFSNKDCELTALASPCFLDVNNRFLFSLNGVNLKIETDVKHVETTEFKNYMRVKTNDGIIGEVVEVNDNLLKIAYTDKTVAGWNNDSEYQYITKETKDCIKLDNGLNSAWEINLKKIIETYD